MKKPIFVIAVFVIAAAVWLIYDLNSSKDHTGYPNMYISCSAGTEESLYICGVDWELENGEREQIPINIDRKHVKKNIWADSTDEIAFRFGYKPDKVTILEAEPEVSGDIKEFDLQNEKEIDIDKAFAWESGQTYVAICYCDDNWVAYAFTTYDKNEYIENMKIDIIPLKGVALGYNIIELGANKNDVEWLIGKGEAVGDGFRYYDGELGIYYDSEENVEFIEFYSGIDGKLQPMIYGVPVFQTKARELVEIIEKHNSGNNYFDADIETFDSDHEIEFYNVSVGIYRDITPDNVDSMKAEMISEGVFDENDEDYLYDVERSQYWATIGIGVEEYYK